ncbi:hypothetical protein HOC13_03040 [Candidatus Woesearchaeota archaeon]|nr:hypothetical protein [Candidatus Woesearchaeota archaeon]
MKKRYLEFFSLIFLIVGIILLINSKTSITGAAIGTSDISSTLILGMTFILVSFLLFIGGESLEEKLKEDVKKVAESHHWIKYHISKGSDTARSSEEIDRDIGYLHKPGKEHKRTSLQERIERTVSSNKELILPYVGEDTRRARKEAQGETVNKRQTYREQFYEPHAAGGGRVIEVSSHISKRKFSSPSTWFKEGRLMHFDKLADGEYIWTIDEEGNFTLGNREDITHGMYQMPPDFGSGEIHEKIDKRKTILPHPTLAKGMDVYGAGEVTIKNGLISKYNADSGHYVRLEAEKEGDPHEPDNFVKQSIDAFLHVSKKIGWKEVKGGAKFGSNY